MHNIIYQLEGRVTIQQCLISYISDIKQFSIIIRFVKYKNIHKEFIGFYLLKKFDAKFIPKTILETYSYMNFDMNKCVEQGYDGCVTIAGHTSRVQKIIKDMYPRIHILYPS